MSGEGCGRLMPQTVVGMLLMGQVVFGHHMQATTTERRHNNLSTTEMCYGVGCRRLDELRYIDQHGGSRARKRGSCRFVWIHCALQNSEQTVHRHALQQKVYALHGMLAPAGALPVGHNRGRVGVNLSERKSDVWKAERQIQAVFLPATQL